MPGKPRHRKGRRPPQSKRRTAIRQPAAGMQVTEAPRIREMAPRPKEPRGAATTAAVGARPIFASIPYVTKEVRTISILAAIILIILIVVSLLLVR